MTKQQLHGVMIELARHAQHDEDCPALARRMEPDAPCECGLEERMERFLRLLGEHHEETMGQLTEAVAEMAEARQRLDEWGWGGTPKEDK